MTEPATTIVAYLIAHDAPAAIEWYTAAFGAQEDYRLVDPTSGRIGHAELVVGDARLYLADEWPDAGLPSPRTAGMETAPVSLVLTVPDVDAVFARAIAAGATELEAVGDRFYGMRSGTLRDPFGYRWMVNTPAEDVDPAEVQRRYDELTQG